NSEASAPRKSRHQTAGSSENRSTRAATPITLKRRRQRLVTHLRRLGYEVTLTPPKHDFSSVWQGRAGDRFPYADSGSLILGTRTEWRVTESARAPGWNGCSLSPWN